MHGGTCTPPSQPQTFLLLFYPRIFPPTTTFATQKHLHESINRSSVITVGHYRQPSLIHKVTIRAKTRIEQNAFDYCVRRRRPLRGRCRGCDWWLVASLASIGRLHHQHLAVPHLHRHLQPVLIIIAETDNATQSSQEASILTSGTVTVTQAATTVYQCPPESSECSAAAQTTPLSTSNLAIARAASINAFTALSCTLTPCPSLYPTTTNALSILESALYGSSVTYSFPPAAYSSYGLQSVSLQIASTSGTNVAPTPVGPATESTSPAVYTSPASSAAPTTPTSVAMTTSPTSAAVSPVTTSLSSSGTTVVPVPVYSTTAATSAPASSAAPESTRAVASSPSSSGTTSLVTASGSPTHSTNTAGAETASTTESAPASATTTPAPTNAAAKDLTAAMGGLAAAVAALMMI